MIIQILLTTIILNIYNIYIQNKFDDQIEKFKKQVTELTNQVTELNNQVTKFNNQVINIKNRVTDLNIKVNNSDDDLKSFINSQYVIDM